MPTQCSTDLIGFGAVLQPQAQGGIRWRWVTSDAGALLLGATDRVINLGAPQGSQGLCAKPRFADGERTGAL